MTTTRSDFDQFSERLDAYGADFGRWPAAAAEEAEDLLAASPQARRRLAEARRGDAFLRAAAEAPIPNGFAFRVVGEVAARRRDRWSWLFGSPGRIGLAGASFCAAALVAGLVLGATVGPRSPTGDPLDFGVAVEVSLLDGDL